MLTKFATVEDVQVLEVKGSNTRIERAGLDKLASYEDYRTGDGYLYTRVRAISSRVNKNHDGWPSEELAKAYLTFIGKPIFVDHNNSDPTRARGVIVDAKLHVEDDFEKAAALDPYYANAPDNHKPPTWIELLLEVDAKQYPKLAKAIINDEIDGVSMGANVERSRCSHCANWATTPEEYCTHVMQKGAFFDRYDDHGRKTSSAAYEDCYDIGFFEISYVFDPADTTALDLGGKRHAIAKTTSFFEPVEAGGKKKIKPSVKNQRNKEMQERQRNDAEQKAFNENQRKVKERGYIHDRNKAYEERSFFEKPAEDYQVPAPAPEGGALGIIGAPPLEGTGKETPYWKHPDKTPSDIKGPGNWVTTVACPECGGGVNRANCPGCEGKGQVPAPKPEFEAPEPVAPSPYRQNVMDQAAEVPEDTRADRMKQKKRTQGSPMDMGGYGDGQQTGSPAPSPQLPDAQNQNCPTCGSAMENGVCPQCTKQAQQPSTQQSDSNDPSSGMMGAMSSFKIASDGSIHYADIIDDERGKWLNTVEQNMAIQNHVCPNCHRKDCEASGATWNPCTHQDQPEKVNVKRIPEQKFFGTYSGEYGVNGGEWPDDAPMEGDDTMEQLLRSMQEKAVPPHAVNMEFDTSDEVAPHEVQGLADRMEPGMTPEDKATRAVGMSSTPEDAVAQLVQWGMGPEMAEVYVRGVMDRRYREDNGGPPDLGPLQMPNDPFLSSFKITKDGSVHYAEQAPLPQSMMTTAPEAVDTLRQEKICEVCGSDMEDGKCEVCQFEEPPEGFDNPDLAKAQEIAEMGAMDAGGAGGGAPGAPGAEPPPGVMAPPGGGGGGGGAPGAGGGQPMASTRKSPQPQAVTNERTAGTIRKNEQPILPATKTVSDHPKTTQVTKEPTRLVQSNTKETMKTIPTKAQVAAEMVRRGTFGVKTASEAEALLTEKGLDTFLADASPASDPAEHSQSVDQVGGEVDNAEGGVTHENVEKVQDIEGIPTMTWSDGKGDSLGQQSPVTSEKFEGGGPIGTQAGTKTADIFPGTDQADKQIDVNKPLQPEFTTGPDTMTWSGETGDSLPAAKPVTTEDSNEVGGPIGVTLSRTQIVTHVLSALKVAEQMVDQGLVNEEQKFELAAQLEQETPEQLAVRRDMLSKTRTAAARAPRTASAPKLSRIVNSSREAGAQREIADDNLGDAAIFGR